MHMKATLTMSFVDGVLSRSLKWKEKLTSPNKCQAMHVLTGHAKNKHSETICPTIMYKLNWEEHSSKMKHQVCVTQFMQVTHVWYSVHLVHDRGKMLLHINGHIYIQCILYTVLYGLHILHKLQTEKRIGFNFSFAAFSPKAGQSEPKYNFKILKYTL